MIIKKVSIDYLDEIFKIENSCFSHPWSEKSLETLLNDDKSAVFVAIDKEKVCGYCGVNTVLDEGYITNIAVQKSFRRQGIGQSLLKTLCDYAQEKKLSFLTLEVRKSNLSAVNLYSKNGFNQVGNRKNYYTQPVEDALLLTKYFV